ncbi:hypothetical protein CC85DRAFT_306969 [Cutaneotrichosporon oleaginosum]|uniref:Carbohydrate kinase PfkB domain-containing protein n=1 Tax=Cutaneotrichosporon oleaginosum TaxID=879819 RepID=A0A0J0XUS7_9TREE|nr:uncharacterized protein CC85DRAFT_306969 [Cutaneotrichosporon oleaginosum]KLT44825.1 hypothetical protein CC85DRAFT_306969 [Cutaneotrichosporon oleaginosum]TXT11964.1 hypothetical protein COLE_02374 [Cutaneotrichosporon oleaginosum]
MLRAVARSSRRYTSTLAAARQRWNGRLQVTPEVEHALETGAPVVALETAILTHGMPFPTNLTTAQSVESIIRAHGAIPATIALLDGRVRVGLSDAELTALADPATPRAEPAVKVSRRDLAPALAFKRAGGTTVAGTMVIAASAGIDSFVTGGIGGVHRGAESSMDVSADLIELGRTPMMVVCAGAKSILDIPRTLEVLETQGVCVVTYGDKADFPAFYSPSSGCASPWRVGSVGDAASLVYTGLTLPSPQSILLAVPIPAEYGARGADVQRAVEQAVRESVEQGIDKRGKEVTPWLLKRVGELTQGTALELNIKLIENNAAVGAQVAAEVARLRKNVSSAAYMPATPSAINEPPAETPPPSSPPASPTEPSNLPPPRAIVFGAAAVDITSATSRLVPHTTTPGTISISAGGVGRNIAHAAQNLSPPGEVMLVSAVGTHATHVDPLGQLLALALQDAGMRADGLVPTAGRTAACSLVLENGDLTGGVADFSIAEQLSIEVIEAALAHNPSVVAFDCNLSPEAIAALLSATSARAIPTLCDPTSVPKLARLIPALNKLPRALTHIAPNILELDHLHAALMDLDDDAAWNYVNSLNLGAEWRGAVEAFANRNGAWIADEGIAARMVQCLPWVGGVWLKAGSRGMLRLSLGLKPKSRGGGAQSVSHRTPDGRTLTLTLYPPPVIAADEVVNTTGAGDTLVGGIVAGLLSGAAEADFVAAALERVGRTLRSPLAVA